MRIKNVHLSDYKRFTKLSILGVHEPARLVVLVGPNGSGKSSIFDSFLLKAKASVANYKLEGATGQYYEKVAQANTMHEIADRVQIDFHGPEEVDLKTAFQVRSAYRNQADFTINQLQASKREEAGPRLARIIDVDSSVSANFQQVASKGLQDLFDTKLSEVTFGTYQESALGDLHAAMRSLFSDPELLLQDFGAMKSGAFRFAKGSVGDFHYKNLSGGEKAAFDILLDVFVKRHETVEAVYCIDEPELHVATGLQGQLIAAILNLLPESAQLWIATHSIGIVREAYRLHQERPDMVAFLDFSDRNFDEDVTIKPSIPNRAFWANIYRITLDDLASLVAPRSVVLCEGNADQHVKGFDADCYNRLFADDYPETLFVSRGGAGQVVHTEHLVAILQAVAEGTKVVRLIDRDNMTEEVRDQKIREGIRVLRRPELEEYLYDPKVLRTFMEKNGCAEPVITMVLNELDELMTSQGSSARAKSVSNRMLNTFWRTTGIPNLGNKPEEFALQFLVPALRETPSVFGELREDVFG